GQETFDPDAVWGYQTATYAKGIKSNRVYGYQGVALCRMDPEGPKLIEKFTLAPGNSDGARAALTMITHMQAQRSDHSEPPVTHLASDRGFSKVVPENWATPLRELGIEQIIDLMPNEQRAIYTEVPVIVNGHRGLHKVLMIDGWPHHIATPKHLHTIKRPATLTAGRLKKCANAQDMREYAARVEAIQEFKKLIAERQTYAYRRVQGPDPTGKERFEAPCCAGTLKDPTCSTSMLLPGGTQAITYGKNTPRNEHQRTITIPGSIEEKIRQRLYWGSDEWISAYGKRTAVEGQFGTLKSSSTEHVRRGWIHVVGHVKTSIMTMLAIAASNLRQLGLMPEKRHTNKKRKSKHRDHEVTDTSHDFEEIDANGTPITDHRDLALTRPPSRT
ncbi:MAG: transposase, partial [Nakamurella sp.]